MVVLQIQGLSKAFGDREILKQINLSVQDHERMGLVGVNGSGKTTLLRCLTGALTFDQGQIAIASGLSLGFLEQMSTNSPDMTAWEVVMQSFAALIAKRKQIRALEAEMGKADADLEKLMDQYSQLTMEYEMADGYACENTARRILIGLGFGLDDFNQPVSSFSGGQKTRLNLGRLLALNPDILLLDEPTNHLDLNSVEWLENFLQGYDGTVLVVSHDRRFLDRVATHMAELNGGELKTYSGNYSEFARKKAIEDLAAAKAFQKQQEYIRKTEDYIRRFKAGIKSKQARGRQSQLDRLERLRGSSHEHHLGRQRLKMTQESGSKVLVVRNVRQSYGSHLVLDDINLEMEKGDKIALIGLNGCGKTTLLKIITGQVEPERGEIELGGRVKVAYFSQEHDDLDPARTVLEEIYDNFNLTLEEARICLGGMLFSEDDVFKSVAELSGGERSRLALLKIILSGANFLLLDEPTNHLDIPACQVVEQLLADYRGTVLMVSHDRFFIDRVAQKVVDLIDGQLHYYWGNYSYYQEKQQASHPDIIQQASQVVSANARQRLEGKELERNRRRLERQLIILEDEITRAEKRRTDLEARLADPVSYSQEQDARGFNEDYQQLQRRLEQLYEDWASLNGELEGL